MVNHNRILKNFDELITIDAPSFGERQIADVLKIKLKEMGFVVKEDQAGKSYGGNAGNIYGFLKGTGKGAGILLSAHMDTVEPSIGKRAVFHDDGTITSQGDTVLGADDVAGLVEILEGIRSVQDEKVPYRDIEVLFPIAEERYIKGTNQFDFTQVRAKEGYVLDMSGEIGSAALKAPSLISFEITIHGKAAHAGFSPETGIHAIQIMSQAVNKIKQGHVDSQSTLNIGTISGGTATNIVPAVCCCTGEIRSFDHNRAIELLLSVESTVQETAAKAGTTYEVKSDIHLYAYEVAKDEMVVKRFENACRKLQIEPKLVKTFGGSDNHNFVRNGIKGMVLSCGMEKVHSVKEYTTVKELVKGAKLVAELIKCEEFV